MIAEKNIEKICRTTFLIFATIILLANVCTAISFEEWNKTFGGGGYDIGSSVRQTSDRGYIIAGTTSSYGTDGDAYLIKTDENGNEQWNKTFDGMAHYSSESSDWASHVQITTDGGYILAGTAELHRVRRYDAWLIRTDSNGNEQWNKTFGGMDSDHAQCVLQTSDGGYIFVGIFSAGGGDSIPTSAWLVKTDMQGNEQWNRTFSYSNYDAKALSFSQTSDNGYIIAGNVHMSHLRGTDLSDWDAWLVKTDSNGNEQWNKTFGGIGEDYARYVIETVDGDYIFVGDTTSYGSNDPGNRDAWLLKTDSNGNEQWNRTFGGSGGSGHTEAIETVIQISGGYILSGYTDSYGNEVDGWLIKTDSNGNERWNKTFGGRYNDRFLSSQQTIDGGYIFSGHTYSYWNGGPPEVWLVRTLGDLDNIPPTVIIDSPIEGIHYRSTTLPELSYSVTDDLDTSPTISVTGWSTEEGVHTVTVSATDDAGNVGSASVTYIVDNTPPTITLNGDDFINIYIGSIYTDPGATATDDIDGPVPVTTTGFVDTDVVDTYTITYTATDSAGNSASATRIVKVIYNFSGFFQPVDNPPLWNSAKAGSAIPVKFSLDGDQGLNIFATGYPKSQKIDCISNVPIDVIEETVVASSSGLSYNVTTDQYNYIWKTDKAWKNSCRQLTILLKDGTYHNASFNLK